MLVPLSWLKEYISINIPVENLTEKLTEVGLAVDAVHREESDFILELEVTSNRPDCLSILGIAREIAAVTGGKVKIPTATLPSPTTNLPMEVKNDFALCPRYTAVIINNVKVKSSPVWMQERLKKVGLRPINNLVDITNYVMFETGNPLHAFDYDKINPKQMVMQTAAGGEKFTSVDEISYILPKGTIIIKDQPDRVIDLCGIKGGLNTGITDETKRVFLHVPVYLPAYIRRTSQALSLHPEASLIYERGANPGGTLETLVRATDLICELADGKIASKITDLKKEKFEPWRLTLRHERLEKLLGIQIKPEAVKIILESLGLKLQMTNDKLQITYKIFIPTYRGDLRIEEDLVEEFARIYGYNNFPQTLPEGETPVAPIPYLINYSLSQKTKQLLVGTGYSEVATYSLVGGNTLKKTGINPENALKVFNPVSAEYEYLRPSLIPNLLSAILLNQPNFEEIKIFELGKIYLKKGNKTEERWSLAGVTTENYYSAKGIVKLICQELNIKEVDFKPWVKKDLLLQSNRTAVIETSKAVLGTVGQINPHVLAEFGIKGQITIFELDFDQVAKVANPQKQYTPIAQYPPIIEDLSFVIQPKTPVGDLIQLIKSTSSIIQSVQLLDSYKDTRTFRIVHQHPHKTLTDKEVGKVREKIIELVSKKFGVKLKS